MKKNFLFLLTILSINTELYAEGIMPDEYSIEYFQNFGKIKGFVQIPKGGQFGSTTPRKPEFDELGIENINFPELRLSAKWDKFILYGDVVYEKFDGTAHLKDDLRTHDKPIPKNSKIDTTHKYLSYNLGMEYNFYKNKNVTISPLLEFSIMDFSYKFDATTPENEKISSGRAFGWGIFKLGGKIEYRFSKRNQLELVAKSAVLGSRVRDASTISLLYRYTLYENNNNKLNLLLGLEGSYLKFRDKQKDMQNYMTKKMSPVYKVGLEIKF